MGPMIGRRPDRLMNFALHVCLLLTCVSLAFFQLRYLAYATPVVVLMAVLWRRKFALEPWGVPFYILIIFGLIGFPLVGEEGLKDLFFIFSGTSIVFVLRYTSFKIEHILWSCVAASLVKFAFEGKGVGFSFIESTSPFESPLAFVYGLIAIYTFRTKQRFYFFLSLFMCFLSFKRIALLALALAIGGAWLLSGKREGRLGIGRLLLVLFFNITACWLIVSYAVGDLDDVLLELTGVSSNQFGMGRQMLLYDVSYLLTDHPFEFLFFGQGAGAAYGYVDAIGATGLRENLHSDIIKIVFEYGFFIASAFVVLLYRSARSSLGLSFVIYTNVIFMTDNILIYHFYLFFLLLMFSLSEGRSSMLLARCNDSAVRTAKKN